MFPRVTRILLTACLLGAAAVVAAPAQTVKVPGSQAEITLSFAPVVKRAAPAVVNIYTRKVVERSFSPFAGEGAEAALDHLAGIDVDHGGRRALDDRSEAQRDLGLAARNLDGLGRGGHDGRRTQQAGGEENSGHAREQGRLLIGRLATRHS